MRLLAQLPTPTIATRIFLPLAGVAAGAKATLAWLAFAASLLIFSLTVLLAPLCEAADANPSCCHNNGPLYKGLLMLGRPLEAVKPMQAMPDDFSPCPSGPMTRSFLAAVNGNRRSASRLARDRTRMAPATTPCRGADGAQIDRPRLVPIREARMPATMITPPRI